MTKPRVLCIDDEVNVVSALALTLRKEFDVLTATSGLAGLALLDSTDNIEVVTCDMRMPGMNGAAVLTEAHRRYPEVTRILLTGQADTASAISAVNDGQIFRFLTKPCDHATLRTALFAGVEHYRLVTAERVLLQETLRGAIATMVDILALGNPAVFGRSTRIKDRAMRIADTLLLEDRWQLEMAASLQHLGYVTLPSDVLEKVAAGHLLSDQDHKLVAGLPVVTERLLAHIPRLETIRAILTLSVSPTRSATSDDPIDLAAEILRCANDSEQLGHSGMVEVAMVEVLRARGRFRPTVIAALETIAGRQAEALQIVELASAQLKPGMILAEDIRMVNGTLLVVEGYVITLGFLERIKNLSAGAIREPTRVIAPLI